MAVGDRIKKKMMEEAMKFMASERGQKLMQNPQLMQALMKAMELRGKVQANIDGGLKNIQKALHLATRDDLTSLGETLDELKRKLESLKRQTEDLASTLERVQTAAGGEPTGARKKTS